MSLKNCVLMFLTLYLSAQDGVSESVTKKEIMTMKSGLKYSDHTKGKGKSPKVGQNVTVHYTGTLEDGTQFDSSHNHGRPLTFTFGVGQVIKGWDEGLESMKVGGKRQLVIPPSLGYGAQAVGTIPANSTLIFDVELISIDE